MDFSNHLQGGECVTESKSDGVDGKDIGNLLMHYQTHFFHGGDKLKNVEENIVADACFKKWKVG